MISLDEFIKKWTGVGIDLDGAYGFQCVDLYRMYVKEVLGFPQSPSIPGAKDIWDKYLPEYYERIPNTPDGVPQKGDIMIWGSSYGPWGHVAVVTEATINTFKCFSQNDPTGTLCGLKKYSSYKGVLGWLRVIKQETGYRGYDLTNADSMKVCIDDHIRVVEGQLVDKSQYEAIKGQLSEVKTQNDNLSSELGAVRGELATAIQKIDSQNKVIASFVNEDAIQLETLKRLERESGEYKDRYFTILNTIQEKLKQQQTMDGTAEAEKLALEAVHSLVGRVKDLEDELTDERGRIYDREKTITKLTKQLEQARKPLSKYTTMQLIRYIISRGK